MLNIEFLLGNTAKDIGLKLMNDNKKNVSEERMMRSKSVMILNALQRLVVVAKYIDRSFESNKVPEEDYERLALVRNSICITANIWNDHLSGSINKLYRGKDVSPINMDSTQLAFYNERMPRSVRFAAKELTEMGVTSVTSFLQSVEEIVEAMAVYAEENVAVAAYLKAHQDSLEDIPMLEMMKTSDSSSVPQDLAYNLGHIATA